MKSVRHRKTNITCYHLYEESTNAPIYKTEIRVTDVENKLMLTKEEWGGGITWETGTDI